MRRVLGSLLGCAILLAASGCGEKAPETATVTGKVTLRDGAPLPGGQINFHFAGANSLASGNIKSDGTYEVLNVPNGDAKVSVTNAHLKGVTAPPGGAPSAGGSEGKYVPINASNTKPETSGLTTKVQGKTHTYDVKLK